VLRRVVVVVVVGMGNRLRRGWRLIRLWTDQAEVKGVGVGAGVA
jgi:hypothetical protein